MRNSEVVQVLSLLALQLTSKKENIMKHLLLIFVVLFSNPLQAKTVEKDKAKYYEGVIIQKGWTKSSQSYCAGGSDYVVLQTEGKEAILSSNRDENSEKIELNELKKFAGKKVRISGVLVTTLVECQPGTQCPSNPVIGGENYSEIVGFTNDENCESIRVKEIELLNDQELK